MSDLLHPFTYEFFRHGFVVAVLAGALCALIGTFVVVRGMAYLGHGLSHAVFGGFAVSALVGVSVVAGAAVWGIAVALMIGRVARRRVVSTDAAIGVLTLASFALGLALLQWRPTDTVNPDAALFGDVLGVSTLDVVAVAVIAAITAALVLGLYRSFVACSFDPDVAAASGVRVGLVDGLLLGLLAVAVLAAMNVMGATLVAAGVVIPPATARLLTARFSRLLWISTLLGAAGGAVGMVASYHLDIASGPVIVLTESAAFAAAYAARALRDRPHPVKLRRRFGSGGADLELVGDRAVEGFEAEVAVEAGGAGGVVGVDLDHGVVEAGVGEGGERPADQR
jgi:manganese/iron transport system permease protein/iron/zinc/copper transport system permease protein